LSFVNSSSSGSAGIGFEAGCRRLQSLRRTYHQPVVSKEVRKYARHASNQVDVYDPASDSWTRQKDMPTRLTHLNPAIDGNTIWLAGGFKGKHPGPVRDEVWKYDIALDAWTAGPPLPEPRTGGGLAVVERKLFYFGGYKADRDTNAGDHWSLPLEGGNVWHREADLPNPLDASWSPVVA
jgi:hypothetical protein